jgi:capsular polysaccharide transport system permease protein
MSAVLGGDYALSRWQMLKAQWRVIQALMLHDIRSRMGGNAFGFLIMGVVWPLSHILLLIIINAALGRAAPYGDSSALWFATGVVPFMAFQYMARFISLGIVLNRALFSFPVVKVTDIVLARAIIEVLNAGMVVLIVCIVFVAFNISFMPEDIVQACLALLSMMLLGVGVGVINAVISAMYPVWVTGFALLQFVFWAASGILFIPDSLPDFVRYPLSFFPPLQGVEWMRSAYFEGYGSAILDKNYLLSFALITLFLGLMLERFVRGKMLS